MERIWKGIRTAFTWLAGLLSGLLMLALALVVIVVIGFVVVAIKDSTVADGFTLHKYGEYAAVSAYHGTEKSITLPTEIDGQPVAVIALFNDRQGLVEEIAIPDTATGMIGNGFTGVPALQRFVVSPEHPTYQVIDGALYSKDGLELIAWPAGRTGTAVIPKGVERIGANAFANCVLSEVILPEGLLSIGDYAFMHCRALRVVQIPASVVHLGKDVFNYDRHDTPCLRLIVTSGSAAYYYALRTETPMEQVLEDPLVAMILEHAVRPDMAAGNAVTPTDLPAAQ